MSLQTVVEQTVTGLGYDCVEIERSAGGLLRITIDHPWQAGNPQQLVAVEDCERVTRQLQFALEVEAVDYKRLEVSSPGIDRPLRNAQDFERFVGEVIDVTLKAAVGSEVAASTQGAGQIGVRANRKKFRGRLEKPQALEKLQALEKPRAAIENVDSGWQIVWSDEPPPKPGARVSKNRPPPVMQALGFKLDEIREARLAPIVDFKGRGHDGA